MMFSGYVTTVSSSCVQELRKVHVKKLCATVLHVEGLRVKEKNAFKKKKRENCFDNRSSMQIAAEMAQKALRQQKEMQKKPC